MGRTLLCVGDSLTYGTGSTPGNTYPEALQRYLSDRVPDIQVVGDGKPGFSTKDYCGYLQWLDSFSAVKPVYYDAVVILLGCNDCRMDNWVKTSESIVYLCRIADFFLPFLKGNPQGVFLCSTLPLADPMPADIVGGLHPWRQSKVENEINPGIKDLTDTRGFGYVDLYSVFETGLDEGLSLYDGIHPFDNGYQLIAETIGRAVEEVFVKNA